MSNFAKEVQEVYQLLSLISVNGDAVDAMAAARSKLRKLHNQLEEVQAKFEEEGERSGD